MIALFEKRQPLVVKTWAFLTYASFAVFMTYFYVYLSGEKGLSAVEVGAIAALQQLNTIFVAPIWGILADRFGRKRIILVTMLATAAIYPIFTLPNSFAFTLAAIVLFTLFYNPIASLLDTIAIDFEEQTQGKTPYGVTRLWSSVGWAVATAIAGVFINNSIVPLKSIFIISTLIMVAASLVMLLAYKPLTITSSLKQSQGKEIIHVLQFSPSLRRFLALVFGYSLIASPCFVIMNVFYDDINAPSNILGAAYAVQAVSEVPFFFFANRLVNRFGAKRLFIFCMIATAVRMLIYGLTGNAIISVCAGALHGVTFGLYMVSMIAFVHQIVPKELRSTGQSLIYMFYYGGVSLGSFLIGWLHNYTSMTNAMIMTGTCMVAFALLCLASTKKNSI